MLPTLSDDPRLCSNSGVPTINVRGQAGFGSQRMDFIVPEGHKYPSHVL
jgi:hypothetical protein